MPCSHIQLAHARCAVRCRARECVSYKRSAACIIWPADAGAQRAHQGLLEGVAGTGDLSLYFAQLHLHQRLDMAYTHDCTALVHAQHGCGSQPQGEPPSIPVSAPPMFEGTSFCVWHVLSQRAKVSFSCASCSSFTFDAQSSSEMDNARANLSIAA